MTACPVPDFRTDRLDVRSWAPLPGGAKFSALCDELEPVLVPEVLEHLPPSMALGPQPDAVARWVRARESEAQVMCVRSADATLIGLLILTRPEGGQRDIHLGYLLAPDAWGQGYGTELVSGLVAAWRPALPGARLIGGVARDNPASARVLLKAGFARAQGTGDTDFYDVTL